MPNHVNNEVVIKDKEACAAIKKLLKGKAYDIDFNKVIPMPLDIEATTEIDFADKGETKDSCGVPLSVAAALTVKYGYPNWYEWSLANWGTKWNAYDIYDCDGTDDCIPQFNTAWSPPVPVYLELSRRFPKATIKVYCDDEGEGRYAITFKGGKETGFKKGWRR